MADQFGGIPVDEAPAAPAGKPDAFGGLPVDAPAAPTAAEQRAAAFTKNDNPGQDAFMSGATLGFAPKILSGADALVAGGENVGRSIMGTPAPYTMGEVYHADQAAQVKKAGEFSGEHPVANVGLELAGGLGLPGAGKAGEFIKGGTGALDKAARSAYVGAGYGAIADADQGKEGIETGAIEGAATGGGLHLLGSAVGMGLPKIAKSMGAGIGEAWQRIRSAFGADAPGITPEARQKAESGALEYVHQVAQKAGATPESIRENPDAALGKPVTGAEAIGRSGTTQLNAAGRRAGATGENLETLLRQRAGEAPDRVLADLSEATGVPAHAIEGDFTKQVETLRADAKPFYEAAYRDADGAPRILDSPELRKAIDTPAGQNALARARRIMANEGLDPSVLSVEDTGRTRTVGVHDAATEVPEKITVAKPTIQTWDYVKRGLDDVIDTYRDKKTGKLDLDAEGRSILKVLNDVRGELQKDGPYNLAIQHGGEPLQLEEAYREAPKLMSNNVTGKQFADKLAKYTPAQQEAMKAGYVADMYNKLQAGKLPLKDLDTPNFIEKARAIMGADKADQFLAKVRVELKMAGVDKRIRPGTNSVTGEIGAAGAEQEGASKLVESTAKKTLSGGITAGVLHALGSTLQGVHAAAQQPVSRAMRDEIGRLLMLPPDQLAAALAQHVTETGQYPGLAGRISAITQSPQAIQAVRQALISTAAGVSTPAPKSK